ncbi:hypothetical protein [Streptomyces sp. NBC_01754]|uniref:hypothetical protein n=1 Tax=Streptomyces sp. NBC_01754 TaxID=2975930 RepID=UPI002DD87C91|nr:hypothetical protein [Streptomyces sp. NBC_01754]
MGLLDPPTRGVYTITPTGDRHPCAATLLGQLATAFASARPDHAVRRPTDGQAHPTGPVSGVVADF